MTSELFIPLTVLVIGASDERYAAVTEIFSDDDADVVRLASFGSIDDMARNFIDLCIVDAGGGEEASVSVVQRVRRRWPTVGMTCLGCRDVVPLLAAGADDAIPHDAPPAVEAAQLRAAFRRARTANAQLRVAFGDVVYDREARRVWCAGKEVTLTPRELRLFDILFLRAGAPVSTATLQDYVWKEEFPPESNALAVYVSYLRRKLSTSRLAALESIRGIGYRLTSKTKPK